MRISDWSSDVCSSDLAWPAVVEDRNLQGYHSIAVPGSCSGYATLLRNFGTWSWADAIGPAVEMARRGHRLTWWTTLQVAADAGWLGRYPESRHVWMPGRWDGGRGGEAGASTGRSRGALYH